MDRRLTRTPCMRGFTMTEISIVLFIFALLMSGVWTVARDMNENSKQAAFSELLLTISSNVRGYASGTGGLDSNTETLMGRLALLGALPSHATRQVSTTWVVDTSFGRLPNPTSSGSRHQSLYVCGWHIDGTPNTHCLFTGAVTAPLFAVEALMNTRYCINAVMRNSNTSSYPGLVAIYINSVERALPINLTAAQQACRNDVNIVDWVFRPNT